MADDYHSVYCTHILNYTVGSLSSFVSDTSIEDIWLTTIIVFTAPIY